MDQVQGSAFIAESLSFTADQPWLAPLSIKENTILGCEYDHDRYMEVLEICYLFVDLSRIKLGDSALVGDSGVTLSGGQKARIALARALYKQSEVYLLDDPFSALDLKLGQSILAKVKSFLGTKTVILTTHQDYVFSFADKVLLLEHGSQVFFGTYDQFLHSKNLFRTTTCRKEDQAEIDEEILNGQVEIADEETTESLSFSIYYKFLKLGSDSHFQMGLTFGTMVCAAALNSGVLWWVSYWIEASDQGDLLYACGLAIFVVLLFLFGFVRNYLFALNYLKSTGKIHAISLSALANAPTSFYDLNSIGKILSRFTRDIIVGDRI